MKNICKLYNCFKLEEFTNHQNYQHICIFFTFFDFFLNQILKKKIDTTFGILFLKFDLAVKKI